MKLILGDCIEKMQEFEPNSVDTIITDPPYGLSFMGKKWDYDIPSIEMWKEALRVAKPGATLMCFGGTRTWHRIAVNIEDAGWQIFDTMMWVYGTGFPKGQDISKRLERKYGNDGKSEQWIGWKSHALKPSFEPIILARKQNEGTYIDNALKYGVSGLDIDGGRISSTEEITNHSRSSESAISKGIYGNSKGQETHQTNGQLLGRYPTNIVFDEEAGKMLDEQSGQRFSSGGIEKAGKFANLYGEYKGNNPGESVGGFKDRRGASRFFYCAKASKSERNKGLDEFDEQPAFQYGSIKKSIGRTGLNTPRKNAHPTVKPLSLMEYLCKLTKTPTGGIVLDPFMGSGTTGLATVKTGREFIGIEIDENYFKIADARIKYYLAQQRL